MHSYILSIFNINTQSNDIYFIPAHTLLDALKDAVIRHTPKDHQTVEFYDLLESWDTIGNAIASCKEAGLIVSDIIRLVDNYVPKYIICK